MKRPKRLNDGVVVVVWGRKGVWVRVLPVAVGKWTCSTTGIATWWMHSMVDGTDSISMEAVRDDILAGKYMTWPTRTDRKIFGSFATIQKCT